MSAIGQLMRLALEQPAQHEPNGRKRKLLEDETVKAHARVTVGAALAAGWVAFSEKPRKSRRK